jgi:hypothetical protein
LAPPVASEPRKLIGGAPRAIAARARTSSSTKSTASALCQVYRLIPAGPAGNHPTSETRACARRPFAGLGSGSEVASDYFGAPAARTLPGWPGPPTGALGGPEKRASSTGGTTDGCTHTPGRQGRHVGRPQLPLRVLLAAVAHVRHATRPRVGRDLHLAGPQVRPAWELALRFQLIEPVGIDPDTAEPLYRLNARGRRALRVLSLGRWRTETDH